MRIAIVIGIVMLMICFSTQAAAPSAVNATLQDIQNLQSQIDQLKNTVNALQTSINKLSSVIVVSGSTLQIQSKGAMQLKSGGELKLESAVHTKVIGGLYVGNNEIK